MPWQLCHHNVCKTLWRSNGIKLKYKKVSFHGYWIGSEKLEMKFVPGPFAWWNSICWLIMICKIFGRLYLWLELKIGSRVWSTVLIPCVNLTYRQTSDMSCTFVGNRIVGHSLRCSCSIYCEHCSNYIFTVSVRSGVFRHNRDSVGTRGLYRHNKTSLLA